MAFDFSHFEYVVDEALLDTVLSELNQGKKTSHWMGFIFPRLRAPNSSMSLFPHLPIAEPVFEKALNIFFDGERADPI